MVCRNAVSFPSQQITGTRYAYFLAQVMPKFTGNFGMTFAKKWTYLAPEIHRNGNESTFQQNIGHSDHFPANKKSQHRQQ